MKLLDLTYAQLLLPLLVGFGVAVCGLLVLAGLALMIQGMKVL